MTHARRELMTAVSVVRDHALYGKCLGQNALSADALVGENAPDFLLVPSDPWSIDSRNVYFDNPRIWANVRARYAYQDMNAEYVLLRKRDAFVPRASDGPCFSAERSRIGKLVAGFLRTSRTMARFVYSDATEYQCSFNPEVLNGTLIPSFIPRTKDEVRVFSVGASASLY